MTIISQPLSPSLNLARWQWCLSVYRIKGWTLGEVGAFYMAW
ncbi:MAG: hypothetical protein R2865_10765 [Deinococcales bacterium]